MSLELNLRSRDNRTPGERINALKLADMDPATAAPAVVVVNDSEDGALEEAVSELAGLVGAAVADRRWLVSIVDRLLYATEQATRYAEVTAGGDAERTPAEDDHARGFLSGVNHVADALREVMNERPVPLANGGIVAAARLAVGAEGAQ